MLEKGSNSAENSVSEVQLSEFSMVSSWLTAGEISKVFRLLEGDCYVLNMTMLQLDENPSNSSPHYIKPRKVLCLIQEKGRVVHCLRLYCINKEVLLWQVQITNEVKLSKMQASVLKLESNNLCGLNLKFADADDCEKFYQALNRLLPQQPEVVVTNSRSMQSIATSAVSSLHAKFITITNASKNILCTVLTRSPSEGDHETKKAEKSKTIISSPTNFVHVSHVGWDEFNGFALVGDQNDETFIKFVAKIGLEPGKVMKPASGEILEVLPIGISTLTAAMPTRPRKAPPPPPTLAGAAPPQTSPETVVNLKAAASTAAPPPPPPPPPPSPMLVAAAGMVPSPPPAPPFSPIHIAAAGQTNEVDQRNELLLSIRNGVKLRKVADGHSSAATNNNQQKAGLDNNLVDALQRALDERQCFAPTTEPSETEDENNDAEWAD